MKITNSENDATMYKDSGETLSAAERLEVDLEGAMLSSSDLRGAMLIKTDQEGNES